LRKLNKQRISWHIYKKCYSKIQAVISIYLVMEGRLYMAGTKRLAKKKEKLSKEENLYRSAVSLMEAVDCVKRFEREVSSLEDAAKKFDKLGNYKDSAERKEICIKAAQDAIDNGTEKTFEEAVLKLENAKSKSDFVDAAEDFKRVRKFGYKKQECNDNISICQKGIRKLETIAVYKRRGIVLCIIIIVVVVFVNTPFCPLVQGMYYQSKDEYYTAIDYYKKSGGILNGNGNMKECYYNLAQEFEEKGSYDKALLNYKLAQNKFDAYKKACGLEKKFIKEALPGTIVRYGEDEWILLDKAGSQALLLENGTGIKKCFDEKGNSIWHESTLCQWLNTDYINKFSEEEKSAMVIQGQLNIGKKKEKELIFIIGKEQYEKYKDIIINQGKSYWLRDSGASSGSVYYVKEDASVAEAPSDSNNIYSRCSFWVKYE